MSIVETDIEEVVRLAKSKVSRSISGEIDLLNYFGSKSDVSLEIEGSDTSQTHLDLLLQPADISSLVRPPSHQQHCLLSSTQSYGVAKKPTFYLKQDMKTLDISRSKKYHEESDNVMDTLAPTTLSRCTSKLSSHSLMKNDSSDLIVSGRESCSMEIGTEEELSGDDIRNIIAIPRDLLHDLTRQHTSHCNQPSRINSYRHKDDLLRDDMINSLNPRAFCKKKDLTEPTSISDQTLLRKEARQMGNYRVTSLDDLSLPFYCLERKPVERDVEKDLRSLGFSDISEVNWNSLYCPKRRDMLRIIHYRMCSHVNPDIVVILDDHEFFCHRILLQSYSEYFDDMKNTESSQRVDITNMNITQNAFLAIYTWMLTVGQGGFQLLTKQNILEVLLACQVLRIKDLENQCMAFIENEEVFCEETAFFLFQLAREIKLKSIQTLMVTKIRNFFMVLVASKDFLDLPLDSLCAFLKSDHIAVHCELEVFLSGVRWLRHGWNEKKEHMEEVMACIRFGLISPLELVDIRNSEQSDLAEIANHPQVQRMIDEGLAVAVKNTLSSCEAEKTGYCNMPPTRNWHGKRKTYKSYQEFVGYLKEVRKNPRMVLKNCGLETPKRGSQDINGNKKDRSGLLYQSSETQHSADVHNSPDISLSSRSKSREKMKGEMRAECPKLPPPPPPPPSLLNVKLDVSTNTYQEFDNTLMSAVIDELIKKQMSNRQEESDCSRRPVAKVSEPVIQTSGCGPRPRLREQAATVIQSAFRGHRTRLGLLLALQPPPLRPDHTTCNVNNSQEDVETEPKSLTSQTSLKSFTSQMTRLNSSDTKIQAELTRTGSLFHVFQNTILVFGGLDPNSNLGPGNTASTVYRYYADKNKWEIFGTLPEPRYYQDVALLKGRIYLAGGVDPRREDLEVKAVCKTVWSFDPSNGTWQQESDMLCERKNFALVAAGGYLFAIGGNNNENTVLSTVERYDPASKKWTWVASLDQSRTGAAVCKHNHMIWVAGGISASAKSQVIKHVECYDPKRNVWMSKSPLRFGRAFGCLVSLRGSLYLVGGASKKSSTAATSTPAIDMWDERNKEWRLRTEMSIPRHSHSVAYIGTQMVILGGTTTMSMRCVSTVEGWCVNRGTWVRGIASLPATLIGHSTVTLPLDIP